LQLAGLIGNTSFLGIPIALALLPSTTINFTIGFDLGTTLFAWIFGPFFLQEKSNINNIPNIKGLFNALINSPASRGIIGVLLAYLFQIDEILGNYLWIPARIVIALAIIIVGTRLGIITNQKDNLLEIIEEILIAGVKINQHRFKTGTDQDHLQEAIKIKNLCKRYNSLFIINDRLDIALASNADGIHLGQDDLDLKTARKLLGYSKIIGISANNEIDISNALKEGCDYIGIGPVFETTTKKNKKPIGIEKIKTLTKDLNIPWFAIGGIKTNNILYLKSNGIKKVALVSQLMNAEDPKGDAIMILKELSHEN